MESNRYTKSIVNGIINHEAVVCVIGMGYVGLPLTLRLREQGISVIGLDIDESKIEKLLRGESYIRHIDENLIRSHLSNGFEATSDFARVADADVIVMCVPTPLDKYREPDLQFVKSTCRSIAPYLRPGQMVSLESTTYPGTTEEIIVPILTQGGLVIGRDIFAVYSPEREDPGNASFSVSMIPKVVAGHTENCRQVGAAFYRTIINEVVEVSSTRVAELTKLLENIQRAVNIGLMNEMKILCDRMGIDIFEVIDAAATKPFGFTRFYPGPGLGGHCIPIDPFYLTWKAREFGLHTRFIELSGEINRSVPEFVISKLVDALNDRFKVLRGSKVLVVGLAYKKDVDDVRESPSIHLMEILRKKGADVQYCDPHVPSFPEMREHHFELESVEATAEVLSEFDAIIISTDHDIFDYETIRNNAKLIVDCRGVYRGECPNVVRA
ncbi:nucleotide sugar dehydrogenase [Roseibium sp. RKSG952]|uniref:nucleotide sugar dehydrogenase n=1 Tax=Roseibium sp. RKSG952 TaxID=2529384 RepID=UPI0012BD2111|nr:nucleotide sugar dehydrogenase [Roseibium sp. RKSG952]MTH95256.1 nucleotide sugar dehydrogenase [Roseibium sp. RKSG952]